MVRCIQCCWKRYVPVPSKNLTIIGFARNHLLFVPMNLELAIGV
jgi:hypothetical protein